MSLAGGSGRLSILAVFIVLGVFMAGAVSECTSDGVGLVASEVRAARVYEGIHWANDGENLVFVRSGQLVVVDSSGGGIRQLSEIGTGQNSRFDIDLAPKISPDGTAIVYTTLRYTTGPIDTDHSFEIATSDLDGGSIKRLTKNESLETNPVWSPDGTRIAFLSDRDYGRTEYRLYTMAGDGSDVQSVAPNTPATGDPAVWSPDGERFAFFSNTWQSPFEEYTRALYTVGADGSSLAKVHEEIVEGHLLEPTPYPLATWSPDGARIAFAALEGGLYVADWNGENSRKIVDAEVFNVHWFPDGSEILYQSDGRTWVVAPDGSSKSRGLWGRSTAYRAYLAWSPDGSQMAVYYPRSSPSLAVVSLDGSTTRALWVPGVQGIW